MQDAVRAVRFVPRHRADGLTRDIQHSRVIVALVAANACLIRATSRARYGSG